MDTLDEEFQEQGHAAPVAGPAVNPGEVLLHAVARFPLLILGMTVLGGVLALAIALSQPNTYMSVGMLLVRMGAREAQTPESAMDPDFVVRGGGANATGDELMMLMNPALQERVVERVGAARLLQRYDPSAADSEDTPQQIRWVHALQAWLMGMQPNPLKGHAGPPTPEMIGGAVNIVADGTDISAQRRTNTIVVSFTGHDPALAQLVASAYLKVLQERHREFFETEDSYSFVTARHDEANQAADEARAALLEQRKQDGIYNLQGEEDALADEIQALETQNGLDAIQLVLVAKQLVVTDAQLESTPSTISLNPLDGRAVDSETAEDEASSAQDAEADTEDSATEPVADADAEQETPQIFDTLDNLLERRQGVIDQLTGLGRLFVKTSPQYQRESAQLREELQSIDESIRVLSQNAASADGTGPIGLQPQLLQSGRQVNLVYTALATQRLDFARQQESLAAGMTAREELLEAKHEELARLVALEPIYTRLQREVAETAQRAADLEQAHSQSETLRLIDSDERMGNLQVTQEPYLPTQKEGPDRLKLLLMGIFGGLALGLAIAVARQILDPRLRYPSDAEASLGLRVLGVVPEQRGWRRAGKKLQHTMTKRT